MLLVLSLKIGAIYKKKVMFLAHTIVNVLLVSSFIHSLYFPYIHIQVDTMDVEIVIVVVIKN
jgi:hypothetical protein